MAVRFFSYSALLLGLAVPLGWSRPASAGPHDVWLLPTELGALPPSTPVDLAPLGQRLDAVLREAVQDFGFSPLASGGGVAAQDEQALTELARDAWVVRPRLGLRGEAVELRLTVVPRASQVLLVRTQNVTLPELEVRSLGMLRELLEPSTRLAQMRNCPEPTGSELSDEATLPSVRSDGRAVLALHAAALGGYLGFALQSASGSDDARLTYPLAALGASVGVGSAMIVSEEWDIDVARAWYLGASIVWPGLATLLIVDVDERESPGQRQLLGLVGAVGGLTLATAGLALGDVSEGGAALTHSGAVLGLLLGGLGELALQGDTDITPREGMGWGALGGVVLSGAVASQFEVPSSTDLLFIDLSALLGGLAGAAIGTPVLVSQDASPTRDRIWLSGIIAGTVAGAGIGYWVTQGDEPGRAELSKPALAEEPASAMPDAWAGVSVRPQLGWQGMPLGLGLSGQW
jgi:hypothetical protein